MPSETASSFDASKLAPLTGPLGLILPTFPQTRPWTPSASELKDVCARAEAAGAGALWACDHLFWHSPAVECLAAVTVAALATDRVAIGPCVLQLPLRRPASVAKQAASVQDLSGGRMILGVGVGTHEGEYEAAGADFHTRGRQVDQGIDDMRAAWAGGVDEVRYRQLPPPPHIPIWVGGSSERALRRAATRGDGWIPLFVTPGDYAAGVERLEKESERAGRDPSEVRRAIVAFISIGGRDSRNRALDWMASLYSLRARSFEDHIVSGDVREVGRRLSAFFEAGAEHVAVFVASDEPLTQFEDLVDELRLPGPLDVTPA